MAKFKVVITDHEYDNIENEKQALSGLDVELLDSIRIRKIFCGSQKTRMR